MSSLKLLIVLNSFCNRFKFFLWPQAIVISITVIMQMFPFSVFGSYQLREL